MESLEIPVLAPPPEPGVPEGALNTLRFIEKRCINCGRCSEVCPHGVFVAGEKKAQLVKYEACMECGACAKNCPTRAILVDSGVGCAAAMIKAALTGGEETCGPECCK